MSIFNDFADPNLPEVYKTSAVGVDEAGTAIYDIFLQGINEFPSGTFGQGSTLTARALLQVGDESFTIYENYYHWTLKSGWAKTGEKEIAEYQYDPEPITPEGTITITTNGTHDVREYATAEVNAGVKPTGTFNISKNGRFDVSAYQYAQVSVNDLKFGKMKIKNNTSKSVVVYGYTVDQIGVEHYPYGYKSYTVNAGQTSADIGVFLQEDYVNTKWKVVSWHKVFSNTTATISASPALSTYSASLASCGSNVFFLQVSQSGWKTLSDAQASFTVNINEA